VGDVVQVDPERHDRGLLGEFVLGELLRHLVVGCVLDAQRRVVLVLLDMAARAVALGLGHVVEGAFEPGRERCVSNHGGQHRERDGDDQRS